MATQQDPWAEFRTGPATQAPARPAPAQPTMARGQDPIVRPAPRPTPPAPPSGYRPSGDGLAPIPGGPADPNRPQPTQAPSGYRFTANGALEPIPGGPAGGDPTSASEAERTAGFLAGRVVDGVTRLAGAVQNDPDAAAPSLGVETVRGVFGDTAANYLSDSDRQQVRAAQIDIIDAALTLGTGAAYTQEQIEGYREAYFPALGDSEETIASKRQALRSLIVNAQTKAGRAAPDIEAALAALDSIGGVAPTTGGEGGPADDPRELDEFGNPIGALVTVTADGGGDGPSGSEIDPAITQEADQIEAALGERGLQSLFNNVGGLSDEAGGVARVITEALQGNFNVSANYQVGRDVERELIRRARERTGGMGSFVEGLGNTAMVMSRGGSLMRAGRAAAASGGVTRANVQRELVRGATREGATVGGVAGFGYGEGMEGSVTGAVTGAAAGAALGNVGQRIGNRVANRVPRQTAASDTMQAAGELGIDPLPAMTGGTITRRFTGGARQGFISAQPIEAATERMQAQGQAARSRIAEETGSVVSGEDAGEVVRRAANVYSSRTSEIGGRLYDRAANLSRGVKVKLPGAIQTADRLIAEASQAPGGVANARDLVALREQMQGAFTPAGIRQMRTVLREQMQERGLRGSNTDRQLRAIVDAAEQDMVAGLRQAGRENAASAYQTASRFWQQRVQTIDEVLEPVLGRNSPRSGEQVLSSLERLARPDSGNAARLRRLMDAMPAEEAGSVRATIINRLGRQSRGSADVVEEGAFSLERFLTHWNDMSPQARRSLFPDTSIKALDSLAKVASAAKTAGLANNTSNTAGAVGVQGVISGALWLVEPFTVFAGAVGQYSAGRLLASRRFAQWLAGTPRTANPAARNAYVSRLESIARAEPALARDIQAFQSSLAANDNTLVSNIAAGEQDQ